MKPRISAAMQSMLHDAHKYGDPYRQIYGKAAHGGAARTIQALIKMGFITRNGKITETGTAFIADPKVPSDGHSQPGNPGGTGSS